ncbi:hypothetical protein [Paenibacillus silagei]|nr:hypothetical protein [Paenibacillus silagei]
MNFMQDFAQTLGSAAVLLHLLQHFQRQVKQRSTGKVTVSGEQD